MSKEEQIISYLQGELSGEELKKFEQALNSDSSLKKEVEEFKELFTSLEQLPMEDPSPQLRERFNSVLENEIQQEIKQNKPTAKIIAMKQIRNFSTIAAVLVIGILVGLNLSQRELINKMDDHTAQLINTMQKNITSESVTGRIEAVQVSNNFENPQIDVLNTLINTLQKDKSTNVRLAATEALNRYASNDIVREAFVRQLSKEKDPFVLIALINSLSEQKVENAIDPLEKITQDVNQAKFIQDEAYLGLIKIQKI